MKLHIFNPENDMALASGSPGYTPPANIREYRRRNRFLPRLWAGPGDVVWDGEEPLGRLFAYEVGVPEICPWGWSPALVHELSLAGVPERYLPSREWLARLRRLSGRESTVAVQREWGADVRVCRSVEDVEECVRSWGRVMMKSPWSSSGKGLMQTDNPNWRGWVRRILVQQGAVVVERLLERQLDCAMEFWLSGGVARYVGLNVFRTDGHGHFLENIQAPAPLGAGHDVPLDGSHEASLDDSPYAEPNVALVSALLYRPEVVEEVRAWYLRRLPLLAPWYNGPVGVDMMVLADGTLHPCIEINWRMTMGMAYLLAAGQGRGAVPG